MDSMANHPLMQRNSCLLGRLISAIPRRWCEMKSGGNPIRDNNWIGICISNLYLPSGSDMTLMWFSLMTLLWYLLVTGL